MTDAAAITHTPLSKRRGLGRGLDALFEDTELRVTAPNPDAAVGNGSLPAGRATMTATPPMLSGGRVMLPITALQPGVYQPRRAFDDQALHELAQSIAQHGIIQPLLVRPLAGDPSKFEIIAGERRWRAAMKAGVHDVPVVINDHLTDREALQLGLIENIQRADLNVIEEAEGYKRLMSEFDLSPERIGEMIGKSRAHVANMVRLLQLPNSVQALVIRGEISAGHARALIGAPNAEELAAQIVAKKLSVRQTEKLVATPFKHSRTAFTGLERVSPASQEQNLAALNKELTDALGLKTEVIITSENMAGRVVIDFSSLDQLDLVIRKLKE